MTTALQNAAYAQSLFEPVQQMMAQRNAGQLAVAQMQLQRQQALEDQERRAQMQIALQGMADDRADQRNLTAIRIASLRDDREREKADAQRVKELQRAALQAHREYRNAGGVASLTEFGDPKSKDPDELIGLVSSLTDAAAQARVETEAADIASGIQSIGNRRIALQENYSTQVASLEETLKKEALERRSQAISALVRDELGGKKSGVIGFRDTFAEAYAEQVQKGLSPEAAIRALAPRFGIDAEQALAQVDAQVAAYVQQRKQEPDIRDALRNIERATEREAARIGDLEKLTESRFRSTPGVQRLVAQRLTALQEPVEQAPSAAGVPKVQSAFTPPSDDDLRKQLEIPAPAGGAGAPSALVEPAPAGGTPAARTFAPLPEAPGIQNPYVSQRGQHNRDAIQDLALRIRQAVTPTSMQDGRILWGIGPNDGAIAQERLRERISVFDDPADPRRQALVGQYVNQYGQGGGSTGVLY